MGIFGSSFVESHHQHIDGSPFVVVYSWQARGVPPCINRHLRATKSVPHEIREILVAERSMQSDSGSLDRRILLCAALSASVQTVVRQERCDLDCKLSGNFSEALWEVQGGREHTLSEHMPNFPETELRQSEGAFEWPEKPHSLPRRRYKQLKPTAAVSHKHRQ